MSSLRSRRPPDADVALVPGDVQEEQSVCVRMCVGKGDFGQYGEGEGKRKRGGDLERGGWNEAKMRKKKKFRGKIEGEKNKKKGEEGESIENGIG